MADLADTIESEAQLPASSSDDGQSATGRSIPEIMDAAFFGAANKARKKARRGVVFSQIVTPGAADDSGRGCNFNTPCRGC